MKEDLIVFKQYFEEAAEKIPAESFFYGTLKHKYRHSSGGLKKPCGAMKIGKKIY